MPYTQDDNIFVVEYSFSQNSFHIHTVGEMFQRNRNQMMRGLPNDYVPVQLTDSREKADQYVETTRDLLETAREIRSRSMSLSASMIIEMSLESIMNNQN